MYFLLKLSIKNLQFRIFSSLMSLILLLLGTAIAVWISNIQAQSEEKIMAEAKGLHLVIGAKGSPLQLVLSSIFHVDNPTGNVSFKLIDSLRKHPMIEISIPISVGDNYLGHKIVGTDENFFKFYQLKLKEGSFFVNEMEVVLGSAVAKRLKLQIGSKFEGLHGTDEAAEAHEHPFKVVGILEESNIIANELILTSLDSYWHVHEGHGEENEINREITSLLVRTKGPMAALVLPNLINQNNTLLAAIPAAELHRLKGFLSGSTEFMIYFSVGLILLAGISILFSFLANLKERQFDIALFRTNGASSQQIVLLVFLEGIILCVVGWILGVLLGHFLLYLSNFYLLERFHYTFKVFEWSYIELYSALVLFFVSILSSLIPSFLSYRTDIALILAKGI